MKTVSKQYMCGYCNRSWIRTKHFHAALSFFCSFRFLNFPNITSRENEKMYCCICVHFKPNIDNKHSLLKTQQYRLRVDGWNSLKTQTFEKVWSCPLPFKRQRCRISTENELLFLLVSRSYQA